MSTTDLFTDLPPSPPRNTPKQAPDPANISLEEKRRRRRGWYKARRARLIHDNYTCQICGWKDETETGRNLVVNHIFPLRMGGTHDLTNLITYCRVCDKYYGYQPTSV